MTRLGSAVKQQQRPSAALLCESDPHGEWEAFDYKLVDAYYMMDTERCKLCNNPVWLCHSNDNRIEFNVKVSTCYAKAELEDYDKTRKGKDMGSGEYTVAVPIGIENMDGSFEPLPTRHEAYQKMPD